MIPMHDRACNGEEPETSFSSCSLRLPLSPSYVCESAQETVLIFKDNSNSIASRYIYFLEGISSKHELEQKCVQLGQSTCDLKCGPSHDSFKFLPALKRKLKIEFEEPSLRKGGWLDFVCRAEAD
jgi:hypothetical protein